MPLEILHRAAPCRNVPVTFTLERKPGVPYVAAFPEALRPSAASLLAALTANELHPAMQGFVVRIQGEELSAPYRVYYAPEDVRSSISATVGDARTLAQCLGTRHWDGFFREECIRAILASDRPWVVPFVVQLVGEYVIEIVQVIADALPTLNREAYGAFIRENAAFVATTRRRVVSYWNCYNRHRFPQLMTYPAFQVLSQIESWHELAL